MPIYSDLAAVGIQGWLSRTPRLRGRRGASTMLRDATAATAIEPLLATGTRLNPEAGEVDGVVSLVGDSSAALDASVAAVSDHLRRSLPGIQFRVADAEAADYFIAYRAMHRQIERGAAQEWQPPVPEVPFARPCEYCGVDPAAAQRDLGPEPDERDRPVCRDCAARLDAAGRNTDPRRAPGPEMRMAEWLAASGVDLSFPDDFASLAGDGTHIATVYADGNRIGRVFTAIAERKDAGTKADLAEGINDATRSAVVRAIAAIARDGEAGIVPHLVGGDDLLVSVAAGDAWAFTQEYLRAFQDEVARFMSGAGLRIDGPAPSASAGVVLHHRDHPFPMAVEQAASALAVAKTELRGASPGIAWADVSAEGGSSGSTLFGPVELSWLEANAAALDALAGVAPAQRNRLLRLSCDELPEQVRRMGIDVVRQFHMKGCDELRTALRIARWMPRRTA